jgi:hypothetical protein
MDLMRLLGMLSCFAFEDTLSFGWFFPCPCCWSTRHCSPGVSHLDAILGLLEGSNGASVHKVRGTISDTGSSCQIFAA